MTDKDETISTLQAEIETLKLQLAHSQQRYDNLFENIGDSVFMVDLSTYTIINANNHAGRRFGYGKAGLIGMSLDALEVLEAPSQTQQLMWESSFSGTRVYECHYRHQDGTLIPVEVSSRIISVGQQDILQNFVRNIRIRKQMEAERQQLIEDLDSFAHTVAHDLKNPLALISSYAGFLETTFQSASPEELREALHLMFIKSQSAISIVEELLLFASIRQLDEILMTPLHMEGILREVSNRLLDLTERRQAHITLPEMWHLAVGYTPWVQQIWVNYLSNAIKYGGNPPHIELGSTLQDDGKVRFWVSDDGVGIPEAELPQLFQKFSRLKNVRAEGHGLGLSIVKRIVEKLKGEVGVESTVGKGSTFWFTLPAMHM